MPLLIDGHNLIGQMQELSLADPDDEEQLLERLGAYQRRRRSEITVVFDAGPRGGPSAASGRRQAGIRVLYARPGQQADDVICRLVRQARDRRGLIVVSSDRAVQAEARHLGATVVSSQEFARRLAPPPSPQPPMEKEQPPSPSEVEAWLSIFTRRRKPRRR